jgi:hypothetical protein
VNLKTDQLELEGGEELESIMDNAVLNILLKMRSEQDQLAADFKMFLDGRILELMQKVCKFDERLLYLEERNSQAKRIKELEDRFKYGRN